MMFNIDDVKNWHRKIFPQIAARAGAVSIELDDELESLDDPELCGELCEAVDLTEEPRAAKARFALYAKRRRKRETAYRVWIATHRERLRRLPATRSPLARATRGLGWPAGVPRAQASFPTLVLEPAAVAEGRDLGAALAVILCASRGERRDAAERPRSPVGRLAARILGVSY